MAFRQTATREHPWYYYVIYTIAWLSLPIIGIVVWGGAALFWQWLWS